MSEILNDLGGAASYDVRNLNALRGQSQRTPQSPELQRQVAREFESLFINMMIQRMREATPQDGLFDNAQTRLAQSLADQQLATQLAEPGIGLAQALLKQMQQGLGQAAAGAAQALSRQAGAVGVPVSASQAGALGNQAAGWLGLLDGLAGRRDGARVESAATLPGASSDTDEAAPGGMLTRARQFVARLLPAARQAAEASGIPLRLMLGQAALESGWGRREIRHADGAPSHNLFGIKAGGGWAGQVVDVLTTEYEQGVPRQVSQTFRAYASYAEAFADYARLIGGSSRYQGVLQAADHNEAARRIQQAGYATDPSYADKLINVMAQLGR